jgi:hypothetical protein
MGARVSTREPRLLPSESQQTGSGAGSHPERVGSEMRRRVEAEVS